MRLWIKRTQQNLDCIKNHFTLNLKTLDPHRSNIITKSSIHLFSVNRRKMFSQYFTTWSHVTFNLPNWIVYFHLSCYRYITKLCRVITKVQLLGELYLELLVYHGQQYYTIGVPLPKIKKIAIPNKLMTAVVLNTAAQLPVISNM